MLKDVLYAQSCEFISNQIKHKEITDNSYLSKVQFPVVTLIGSTKFKKEFRDIAALCASLGYIVLTCHLFGHSGDDFVFDDYTKKMLDCMHFQNIRMSDVIVVINKDQYIGTSTCDELLYAISLKKEIFLLEQLPRDKYKEFMDLVKREYRGMNIC